jgi:dsDNA-specific endonuclease/ATPase MutS2
LERVGEECPKCGNREAVRADGKRVLEVDVAHGGETVERALAKLEQAVDETLKAGYARLRVIHGYGSQAHHTHRIQGAVRAKLEEFQKRYGGRLETDQNPGAMEWILARTPKKLGRAE